MIRYIVPITTGFIWSLTRLRHEKPTANVFHCDRCAYLYTFEYSRFEWINSSSVMRRMESGMRHTWQVSSPCVFVFVFFVRTTVESATPLALNLSEISRSRGKNTRRGVSTRIYLIRGIYAWLGLLGVDARFLQLLRVDAAERAPTSIAIIYGADVVAIGRFRSATEEDLETSDTAKKADARSRRAGYTASNERVSKAGLRFHQDGDASRAWYVRKLRFRFIGAILRKPNEEDGEQGEEGDSEEEKRSSPLMAFP